MSAMTAATESHIAVVKRRRRHLQYHPYCNLSPLKLFMLLWSATIILIIIPTEIIIYVCRKVFFQIFISGHAVTVIHQQFRLIGIVKP